jgi:hypothetical protein
MVECEARCCGRFQSWRGRGDEYRKRRYTSCSLVPGVEELGSATRVKPNTIILHSRADETVPFCDFEELVRNGGLPPGSLIEVGMEHRLGDEESLRGCCGRASGT